MAMSELAPSNDKMCWMATIIQSFVFPAIHRGPASMMIEQRGAKRLRTMDGGEEWGRNITVSRRA